MQTHATRSMRPKIIAIYMGLTAANLLTWAWALLTFQAYPVLMGTALLAYSFGLRHAVDADHIAAIDNVTRKLMQAGQRPVSVGLYFALGHSTVVVLGSAGVAVVTASVQAEFAELRQIGAMVGTLISASFLFVIAVANFIVLRGVWRTFRRVRAGDAYVEDDLNLLFAGSGLLGRILRPVFRLISRSWHMYPLGFLFGLGFDTATEIGLLGLSAAGVAQGLPIWSILVFPALFTAGMTLVDTTDGILMLKAYGWAFMKPIRKLYYNLTITAVSVAIASIVGGIELLGVIAGQFGLSHGVWGVVAVLNDNFGLLGFLIIGVFVGSWGVSALFYRMAVRDG